MRLFLLSSVVAAGMALAVPAAAAGRAPAAATVTIVIPAFPAASVAAAVKKAMAHMPNIKVVKTERSQAAKTPLGALTFGPDELNRTATTQIGKIAGIYPATLPGKGKGHLIVIALLRQSSNGAAHPDTLTSVVQRDSKEFKLHVGERAILVTSRDRYHVRARVLPYNGPELSQKNQ